MGVHDRYDDYGLLTAAQRTGQPGRHRAKPATSRRAYGTTTPACDATEWDYQPYRARHKPSARVRPLVFGVSLTVVATCAVALTAFLGPSSASAGGAVHQPVHRARRSLQLTQAQLAQQIRNRAASEAARYSAIIAKLPKPKPLRPKYQSPAKSPVAVVNQPATPSPSPPVSVPPVTAATGPGPHALYSDAQLRSLWVAEGGSPALAATAACIADHESGDGSGNARPWADNGVDLGLWQIDPGNYSGPSSNLFLPTVNAKVAVQLQRSQGWYPWTTRHLCGV